MNDYTITRYIWLFSKNNTTGKPSATRFYTARSLTKRKKNFPSPLLRETFHNAQKRFDDVDSLYI